MLQTWCLSNPDIRKQTYTDDTVSTLSAAFDGICFAAELVPQWSTHVGNNTVLEDDVVFLHKQEELAVARGLGRKPVAQVS